MNNFTFLRPINIVVNVFIFQNHILQAKFSAFCYLVIFNSIRDKQVIKSSNEFFFKFLYLNDRL